MARDQLLTSSLDMSGFDDLLSSSSRPFEDNPFANPFDKPRSSSPDPWSSYGQQQDQPFQDEAYASPFGSGFATTTEETHHVEREEGHNEQEEHDHGTPANHNDDIYQEATAELDGHEPNSVKSPGFRESVEPEHTDAPPLNLNDDKPSTPYAPSFENLQDRSRASSSSSPAKTPVVSGSVSTPDRSPGHSFSSLPSPPPTQTNHFVSPLEQGTSVSQTFAGLSLGGASFGGWQEEHEQHFAAPSTTLEEETRNEREADEDVEGKGASDVDIVCYLLFTSSHCN